METPLIKGQYQILEKLSEGGFGVTYLAEDRHRPSGRRCVLKQLKPASVNVGQFQLIQERFRQEAIILENLGDGHPQIPELYSYFEDAGLFYIAQEWIEGETLTEIGRSQAIDEQTVITLLRQILPVLDHIHGRGIIHRDLKPANIICRHSDHLPVLIDFGAVKEVVGTQFDTHGHPKSSIMIGTPGFCPPEQAAGYPTYASDLYSLGMTMIVMLTCKSPIEFNPDPFHIETFWHQYVPNVSQSLKQVLDRSIQFHPRDRYSTAQLMLADLSFASSSSLSSEFTKTFAQGSFKPHTIEPQATSRRNHLPSFLSPFLVGIGVSALAVGGLLAFGGQFLRVLTPENRRPASAGTNDPPITLPDQQSPKAPPLEDEDTSESSQPKEKAQDSSPNAERERIIGLWETEELKLSQVVPVRFVSRYRQDGGYQTTTFYGAANKDGFYGQGGFTDETGTWIYEDGILTTTTQFGIVTQGSIQWINNDTVKVTITRSPLAGLTGTNFRADRRPG